MANKFTVEISLTGVAVMQINTAKKGDKVAKGFEFLPLKHQPMSHMVGHSHGGDGAEEAQHVPVLSFCLSDLSGPNDGTFKLPVAPAQDGTPVVQKVIAGQQVLVEIDSPTSANFEVARATDATFPPSGDNAKALDWIPDAEDHLGLSGIIHSTSGGAAAVYQSRVILPAGCLESRNLILAKDGTVAKFYFRDHSNNKTAFMAVAEQVVWRRENVEGLRVSVDWPLLELNGAFREQRGETSPVVVRLAIGAIPLVGRAGRYNLPAHLPMFSAVSSSGQEVRHLMVEPLTSMDTTSHGACPPVRYEHVT
jgi:hypothetical protein